MSNSDQKLTSFGSKAGQVEVYPEKPQTILTGESIDPKTLAARDSLALQEAGSVVSEEIDVDEYSLANSADDSAPGKNRRRSLRIGLLLALVLAVVLATVLTSDNFKQKRAVDPGVVSGAQEEANVAPTTVPTNPLELTPEYQILKPYVTPPDKLLDPETPQGKAFEQLLSEDIPEDKEFRVKQRFAMMVLYFAMGGENWAWQSGWSDFSEDECDWHGVAICRFRDGRKIAAGLQIRKYSYHLDDTISSPPVAPLTNLLFLLPQQLRTMRSGACPKKSACWTTWKLFSLKTMNWVVSFLLA